jgi:hypothetical protein
MSRNAQLVAVMALVTGVLLLGGFGIRMTLEIAPWFGNFSPSLQVMTLLAASTFLLFIPVAFIDVVRMFVRPRVMVREARWTTDGIEAKLSDDDHVRQRWGDLSRVVNRGGAAILSFADGRSLEFPQDRHVVLTMRIVLEHWPIAGQSERVRRGVRRRLALILILFNLLGAVSAVTTVMMGRQDEQPTPLETYLLLGWGLPLAMATFVFAAYRVLLWQSRAQTRASRTRQRQRLRYPS